MKFTEIYKFPLVQDEYDPSTVWTSDELRAFDFHEDAISLMMMSYVIAIINSTMKLSDFTNQFGHAFDLSYKNGIIYYNNQEQKEFIYIRGLGHITGTLRISEVTAYKLQDEFAQFIIDRLTK